MRRTVWLLLLGLVGPAFAAEPETLCGQAPPPPEPWTSWSQSGTAMAGGEPLSAPRLILGKPVVATLRPQTQVHFPSSPPGAGRHAMGGLFTLALKEPARVGIALSQPAWVDVVTGGTTAPSVDEGRGPDCSGIAKIVWFDLPAGVHLVALSGSTGRELRVMAADARANRPRAPLH